MRLFMFVAFPLSPSKSTSFSSTVISLDYIYLAFLVFRRRRRSFNDSEQQQKKTQGQPCSKSFSMNSLMNAWSIVPANKSISGCDRVSDGNDHKSIFTGFFIGEAISLTIGRQSLLISERFTSLNSNEMKNILSPIKQIKVRRWTTIDN